MPRTARIKGQNQIYHITQRGNNREKVFTNDEDKLLIMDIIFEMRIRIGFIVYAYCIMDNHYHLIINDNENDISKIMKSINYTYVRTYNYIYQRSGHLFQERFFSEIIESELHLHTAINYIHDNPVRAGITNSQNEYRWSSSR